MAGRGKGRAREQTLSQALSKLLVEKIVPSLKRRVEESASVREALAQALAAERTAGKTSDDELAFRDRTIEQVGASWVLATVFVRYLEDRGWLSKRRIAGEGAEDSEQCFGQAFSSLAGNAREYLLAVFRECAGLEGASEVFGPRSLLAWKLGPDADGARALLEFWRERVKVTLDDGTTEDALRWRFESDDTRILGDLYQELSESVRERYALLQTPDFVEKFILSYTLSPAMEQWGVDGLRVLDPTCGSGHFLLGAFEAIRSERRRRFPSESPRESALRALACVYGVDLNPYAVAISRFRLLIAFAKSAGIERLSELTGDGLGLSERVIVADSLIPYGAQGKLLDTVDDKAMRESWGGGAFTVEDPAQTRALFRQHFHVVVGNPPYITCKDATQRDTIREQFPKSAYRTFALGAPFTERFFQLAVESGYVGMINANSFMKREFGRPLIEDVLRHKDLTHVVDTSGAFIPGHGTPTVILFARNRPPERETVRAVLGKRGEPSTPDDPEKGAVWSSIVSLIEKPGEESDYVSVANVKRATFEKHPWSLGGGGAGELKELIEQRCEKRLGDVVEAIGRSTHTGQDEVFFHPVQALNRIGVGRDRSVPLVTGEQVRDWSVSEGEWCLFPYDRDSLLPVQPSAREGQFYWSMRTLLRDRQDFGEKIERRVIAGRVMTWFEHSMFFPDRFRAKLSIGFAFVATHNHFVLDRGGKVFNRSAPIIKLREGATEDEHLALLAWLNSSVACFWMKQVFQAKATAVGDVSVEKGRAEANRYEFAGTGLGAAPIPRCVLDSSRPEFRRLVALAREIESVAAKRSACSTRSVVAEFYPGETGLLDGFFRAEDEDERLASKMVSLQEELDWLCYELLGLCEVTRVLADAYAPERRPFLAAESSGDVDRDAFRARKAIIDTNASISLIESPMYKRTWQGRRGVFGMHVMSDEELRRNVCIDWLAETVERELRKFDVPQSAASLAARLLRDAKAAAIVAFVAPKFDDSPRKVVEHVLLRDSIPHLATLRFTEAGWEKRQAWEKCWSLQRREDAGESVGAIEVPPKYDAKDYREGRYWSLRGRLDVARERFIAYPEATKDDDPSPLYGWAGWNHLERANALAALYQQRKTEDGWAGEKLVNLLAGLAELLPWLAQWHNQREDSEEQSAAEAYAAFVSNEARANGVTMEQLRTWGLGSDKREERAPRVKKGKKSAGAAASEGAVGEEAASDAKPKRARGKKAAAGE
ncbi:MAG: BREX-2 system adenine-specific DNA-methyltransferase PglX [Myxococcales bacterium]|nr:BREX-2 system adenine-specific DNA-methyltransferase PglX [Myxococcales bacterium]